MVTGTILFLLVASFITAFFYTYQRRLYRYVKEKEELENSFQREILKAQLEMQEQTFLIISQEIHDNIGQILSLIRLNICTIGPDDYVTTERKLSFCKELLDKAIEDLRNLSKRLNAEYVRQQYLSDSLRFQLDLIEKTELYHTHFELHGEERPLHPEKKLIVFRIAQEAFNNIIKHAKAKTISVVLDYLPDKTILSIQDDGSGFEPSQLREPGTAQKGIGTHNMFYRATLIGGQFTIKSEPGVGALAQLILPTTY
jgi:signal transduction histidine kinase